MNTTTTTDVELCSRCRASIALTSYTLPFEENFTRAYHNPSKADCSFIESSLADPSLELTTLADEIRRIESLLNALKAHHAQLDRHIHRSARFIQSSPIRQLPTEVLGIIFGWACTSFQQAEYKTPLSISLVCSKWRDIVISMPALWTNIYVAPYTPSCGVPVYQHYLQRCGGIPISVKVEVPAMEHPTPDDDDDDFPFEQTYEYHVDVMGDIYETFAQWKVAEFHMKEADVQLLEHLAGPWLLHMERLEASSPILESLTLAIDGPMSDLPSIFNDAPLLSTVKFRDRSNGQIGLWTSPGLPWGQLRRVYTDQANALHLTHLNDDFQDGESRKLVLNGPYDCARVHFHLHPSMPFTLSISTLVLDSHIWTYNMCAFFRNVAIPTLEDLTIITPDPKLCRKHTTAAPWTNQLPELPRFLARSQCTLKAFSLIMRGRPGDDFPGRTAQPSLADSLVDVLDIMDHLRRLQVIEAESGPPLLNERLFQQLSANSILPELTSLELVWAENRQPDRELLPALSSRADGSLSSVVLGIRNGGNLGPEVLECMRGLRQNGVQAMCW